jgi:hypothetical protein
MPTFGPFAVIGGEVATGIFVQPGDALQVIATGFVNFGGGFLGTGAGTPILPADGDNWETPANYPAPQLRKNSLIFRVRPPRVEGSEPVHWFQGGTNVNFTLPAAATRGELVFRANDGQPDDNSGTAASPNGWAVTVELVPAPTSAGVVGIEVVQCVQRSDNSIPLIAGKPTLVRVYVRGGRTGLSGVRGTLTVTAGAEDFSVETLPAINEPITAPPVVDRNRGNSSLNFRLSLKATRFQKIKLTVLVTPLNQSLSIEVQFAGRAAHRLFPVLVVDTASGLPPATMATFNAILSTAVIPRFPVPEIEGFSVAVPTFFFTRPIWKLSTWVGWGDLLSALVGFKIATGTPGILVAITPAGDSPGISTGIAPYGSNVVLADSGDPAVLAHELAHVFGIKHSPCTGPDSPECLLWNGGCDSRLPGNGVTDEPGWDASTGNVIPAGVSELMSYCSDRRWPSSATYSLLAAADSIT